VRIDIGLPRETVDAAPSEFCAREAAHALF
jgi:hypothetical protein